MSNNIDIELNNIVLRGWELAREIDWESERERDLADRQKAARSIERWIEVDKQQQTRNEFRANNIV